MKISSEKGHIFFSGNINANIGNDIIISENKNEVLGVIFESNLSLGDHIKNVCRKASQKHYAVVTVPPYICLELKKVVMKAFLTSYFGYYFLAWMIHSRNVNDKKIICAIES